ncbi:MAG: hydroxysqualene dehydroxylase HpnE [Candidatus Bipolaricaulis sp.]|nr:hydroxysqualene dehydroxylase HpnE [Candidatus Bipolaricaulis sp.]
MPRVVVVGAGFAGMAAACRLTESGADVAVFERSPRLGGRAASFRDRESGEDIDYGHHVLMRCCTAATDFLTRIGARSAVRFQDSLSIPILCAGERSSLRSSRLPGILHLAPALLRYRPLSFVERLRALRAGAVLALGWGDGDTFADWLARRGQSEPALRRLWEPISVATLNASAEEVGVAAARKVFRDGFFVPHGADMGLFARPLAEVFDAARRYVEARGGAVEVGAPVSRIAFDGSRAVGVELSDGRRKDADVVIVAVPPEPLSVLAAGRAELASTLETARRLTWAPIFNVHLWFDRPVLDDDFVMAVDSLVQAVFALDRVRGAAGGRHLVLSQSAAEAWISRADGEIVRDLTAALREVLPTARDAGIARSLVLRHRHATFVPGPGSDALRPTAKTALEGVFLAGDWTATGWPSTIEGAVRSGINAAAGAVLEIQQRCLFTPGD